MQLLTEHSNLYHSPNAEKWKVSPKTLKLSNIAPEEMSKYLTKIACMLLSLGPLENPQQSQRKLEGTQRLGLSPDLIVCRSENPIGQAVKDKISNFCHVVPEQVRFLDIPR